MNDKNWKYKQENQPDCVIDGNFMMPCVVKERKAYWRNKKK